MKHVIVMLSWPFTQSVALTMSVNYERMNYKGFSRSMLALVNLEE